MLLSVYYLVLSSQSSNKQLTCMPKIGELKIGDHPLQLYSLGTPNGIKVSILLEELGIEYDAWLINIMEGDQFTTGFMDVNPNAMIPCLVDRSNSSAPVKIFESNHILLYLAEKYGQFLPTTPQGRAECLSWLFWQSGTGPYMGVFNTYYFYSKEGEKDKDSIDRWALENKRLLAVLNTHLEDRNFMCGDDPSIADFAIFPWVRAFRKRDKIATFLSLHEYAAVVAWLDRLLTRPAVLRGCRVNAPMEVNGLKERHSKEDFEKEAYTSSEAASSL
eukprot:TRINITY_DN20758_c0_g1_i2.p1 TRINITY_DN20758_c0_g1~~TRINITY_DN20758_c0_g1_i2.p1  ORF type:complete len:275 (-),score=47.22 TRINITY_DN20758_c0_g1_i2:197-1021(-)